MHLKQIQNIHRFQRYVCTHTEPTTTSLAGVECGEKAKQSNKKPRCKYAMKSAKKYKIAKNLLVYIRLPTVKVIITWREGQKNVKFSKLQQICSEIPRLFAYLMNINTEAKI